MIKFRIDTIYIILLLICVFLSCKKDGNKHMYNRLFIDAESTIVCDGESEIENDSITVLQLLVPTMPSYQPSQIIKRKGYITSYNHKTLCPNWVAWHLTKEHTDGENTRKGVPYYACNGIVYGIGKVTPETCKNGYFVDLESKEPRQELSDWSTDYNMSHGHLCPAGDNKWDKAAMNQSFLLTNMCPQNQKLNGGSWKKLEEKCRIWANKYEDIYIVAGPIFFESSARYLGRITIPDAFFKVILCLNGTPKAIGFVYENNSNYQSMNKACCTVDHVEEMTGYDFFNSIDDSVESLIESECYLNDW